MRLKKCLFFDKYMLVANCWSRIFGKPWRQKRFWNFFSSWFFATWLGRICFFLKVFFFQLFICLTWFNKPCWIQWWGDRWILTFLCWASHPSLCAVAVAVVVAVAVFVVVVAAAHAFVEVVAAVFVCQCKGPLMEITQEFVKWKHERNEVNEVWMPLLGHCLWPETRWNLLRLPFQHYKREYWSIQEDRGLKRRCKRWSCLLRGILWVTWIFHKTILQNDSFFLDENWIYEKRCQLRFPPRADKGAAFISGITIDSLNDFIYVTRLQRKEWRQPFWFQHSDFFSFSGGKLLWQFGTAILSDVALAREFQISRRRFRHCDWIEDLTCCLPHFWTSDFKLVQLWHVKLLYQLAGSNQDVHSSYWPMDLVDAADAPIACLYGHESIEHSSGYNNRKCSSRTQLRYPTEN